MLFRSDDNIQGAHTDIRPKEEIEVWLKNDPITHLEQYLLNYDLTNRKDLELIRVAVREEIEDALAFARNSPYPKAEELHHYVYAA